MATTDPVERDGEAVQALRKHAQKNKANITIGYTLGSKSPWKVTLANGKNSISESANNLGTAAKRALKASQG